MSMNKHSIPADSETRGRRILICDDDRGLTQLLSEYLSQHGLEINCVDNAEDAIELLNQNAHSPDVLVLDLMLPGIDGLAALKHIRLTSNLPILMMSARGEPIDRVIGLELGADDYLCKPCFPRELLARLHVLLRRGQDTLAMDESASEVFVGNLRLQPSQRHAWVAKSRLSLTGAEYAVLWALAQDVGKFVSREKLTFVALHRPLERFDRAIDVHVSRLRKKLQQVADDAPAIDSARGAGYVLVSPFAHNE
jgi:two-component system, OmpR family, response regulator CpxR